MSELLVLDADPEVRARGLLRRWDDLVASSDATLRVRDAAVRLGVAEGDLVASLVGTRAERLRTEGPRILADIGALGPVMALTRNEHCVIERTGIYENIDVSERGGIVLGGAIDLRVFGRHWHESFVVTDRTANGPRRSLQFFDASGTAVHKIYQQSDTDLAAFDRLVEAWRCTDRQPRFRHAAEPAQTPAPALPNGADRETLRGEWAKMQDTHDFHGMLRRLDLPRHAAMRLAGDDFARPVSAAALANGLERARNEAVPIMVFVANPGCIEIFTGTVHELARRGPWFNVLDPDFNLHLREDAIHDAFVVRKPTRDGVVTSLELFDEAGFCFAQLFGARKPGQAERAEWTAIADALS